MKLGETIATYDVDLALRGESGKFEVTTPTGETYYVISKANSSILKPELSSSHTYPQAFFIRKIAEPVALEKAAGTTLSTEAETATMPSGVPFLLENREQDGNSPAAANLMMAAGRTRDELPEVWTLDLVYSELEGGTEPPFASVCVKTAHGDHASDRRGISLTSRCGNFNELDVEIRKLQAQLDEICSRAKKKFYKTRAAAASA